MSSSCLSLSLSFLSSSPLCTHHGARNESERDKNHRKQQTAHTRENRCHTENERTNLKLILRLNWETSTTEGNGFCLTFPFRLHCFSFKDWPVFTPFLRLCSLHWFSDRTFAMSCGVKNRIFKKTLRKKRKKNNKTRKDGERRRESTTALLKEFQIRSQTGKRSERCKKT